MKRYLFLSIAILLSGCQLLLPDLKVGENDAGASEKAANGQPCTNKAECESDICINDVCCSPGGACCNESTVCSGNFACDLSVFHCYDECAGEYENDEYCASGYHCDANTCWEDIVVGNCNENTDCVSGECVGDSCCEHAGLCCSGDQDCPDLFQGCDDEETMTCVFSAFLFPDTGQAGECYDLDGNTVDCSTITSSMDYYGQDGHYPGTERVYDDAAVTWIVDQVTGLAWWAEGTEQTDWNNAYTYCSTQNFDGLSWRLPKRHELLSLVDFRSGGGVGAVDSLGLDPTVEQVWTATGLAGDSDNTAWVVNFDTGSVTRVGKSNTDIFIICVGE